MTRENVQDLLAMIQGTYPNYKPADKTATINAWLMALEEYDKNQVAAAFKMYLKSNSSGFAPSPGQLIENIQILTRPQDLNEMEAWSLVSKALKNGYYGAEEEFAKLPTIVQKAVGQPSQLRAWATDEEYDESVVSSNFMRSYRSELARAQQISKLPQGMRAAIGKINENHGIEVKPYVAAIEDNPVKHKGVTISEKLKKRVEEMKAKWL